MSKIKFDKEQIESIFNHHTKEGALLIASDGNVFLDTPTGKNFCRDHCKRVSATFASLTREAFEAGATEVEVKVTKSHTDESGDEGSKKATESTSDWRKSKWDDMIAFAKTQGLEVKTAKGQKKDVMIAEIEEFLDSKEIGASDITNHKTQE